MAAVGPLPVRFDVWVAALSSGYAPLARFVAWADQLISAEPNQPRWVLDLSLARDAESAERVVALEWSRLSESTANGVPPFDVPGMLHLGFLYLRFIEQRMSMAELLLAAGNYVDGQGYGRVDAQCESFYYLLNEIDDGGPTIPSDVPLNERADKLFMPFTAAAGATVDLLPGS